jgi:hypothetical protein
VPRSRQIVPTVGRGASEWSRLTEPARPSAVHSRRHIARHFDLSCSAAG